MNSQFDNREQISCLMDGQLDDEAVARLMNPSDDASELLACWASYHLVRDVLQDGAPSVGSSSNAFLTRFRERLERDALPDVPADLPTPQVSQVVLADVVAANESVFRWRMVAGVASVAAVVAVAWGVFSTQSGAPVGSQLAAAPSAVAVPVNLADATGPVVMIRDPRLDELLAAHKQAGGNSALQVPAGFLRNATFEGVGK